MGIRKLVLIEIDDETWELYKKSWALFGVKTDDGVVKMLEVHMCEESMDVIDFVIFKVNNEEKK